jgi:UDP-GlcNAc3NAcA epimerase
MARHGMKLLTVVGARPQFIKAAPLHRAIAARPSIEAKILHTGQHFDDEMSAVFFQELEIPAPAWSLGVNRLGHGAMTGRMMEALEPILLDEAPDVVVVYGDTNSTLAAALVAAKLNLPIAHVEAGLRSFNRRMPEEINRVLCDHVSRVLLCPTHAAVENLKREGIERGVHHTGDVMYDAALHAREKARSRPARPGGYGVATVHRQENTDSPAALREVIDYLRAEARSRPIVLPLHPRTRAKLAAHGIVTSGLEVTAPLGYLEMAALLAGAEVVYTDSGGLQKEAYFHRVPCVTLRDETEWIETVSAGWNRLWKGPPWVTPRRDIAEYGDGRASEAILDLLVRELA